QDNFSWSGNIPPGQGARIPLPVLRVGGAGEHELIVEILESNGSADLFTNNNLKIQSFRYTPALNDLPSCEDLEGGAVDPNWLIYDPDQEVRFKAVQFDGCAQNGGHALGLQTWGAFPSTTTVEELYL